MNLPTAAVEGTDAHLLPGTLDHAGLLWRSAATTTGACGCEAAVRHARAGVTALETAPLFYLPGAPGHSGCADMVAWCGDIVAWRILCIWHCYIYYSSCKQQTAISILTIHCFARLIFLYGLGVCLLLVT